MDTLRAMLIACVGRTFDADGPVLELGCGIGSTPLLHEIVARSGRRLVSLENNPEYLFSDLGRDNHEVRLVEEWANAPEMNQSWDVALVDHAPGESRVEAIMLLQNGARLIVVHDTGIITYGYEDVFGEFRYRHDDRRGRPWTTVVSNFDDLKWLK